MKSADLHLHTRFSDGTFTPEELAARARANDLAAVALTDHDTVEGCRRMAVACAHEGIEFIPGAEFTAETEGQEVHILGYWLDTESGPLLAHLARFQQVRQSRIHEMVDRLNAAGVAITADQVFAVANCNSPGRPHVARALVAGGFVGDFDVAFDRFLKKGRPAWVPKARMEASEAVGLIHDAGGVAVLAHPGLYRNDQVIPRLAAAGVDGLECWHTKHSASASEGYARTAASLGLVATGGSDCHGESKGAPLIGSVRLPYEQVDRLRERRPHPPTAPTVG